MAERCEHISESEEFLGKRCAAVGAHHVHRYSKTETAEEKKEKFKVGDVVQLNSGGPLMTAYHVIGHSVECHWFVDGKVEMLCFWDEMLKVGQPPANVVEFSERFDARMEQLDYSLNILLNQLLDGKLKR